MKSLLLLSLYTRVRNPDTSQGLPAWMNPIQQIYNWAASIVVQLSGLGIVFAAALLIFSFYTGSRLGKIVGGILAAICAVMLAVNAGSVINLFT